MNNIPLIIPSYNQPTYLRNLCLWWKWYNKGDIYIIDNDSTNAELFEFYHQTEHHVIFNEENMMWKNLGKFIDSQDFEYFVIAPPDMMPTANTPPNFLEVWKFLIDEYDYHHVGFSLPLEGVSNELAIKNESEFWDEERERTFEYKDEVYTAYHAPTDSAFALYKTWEQPMNGEDWGNSLRLFEAYHLPFYLTECNEEMDAYFKSCKKAIKYKKSTGVNNYRPQGY